MHRSSQLTKAASFAHDSLAPSRSRHSQSFMDTLPVFLSHRSPPLAHEKSLFFRQGEYWVIGYRTTVALLKATRGLQDLALLLGNPGREFHVCELVGRGIGKPLLLGKGERAESCLAGWTFVRCWSDPGRAGQGPNTSAAWTISEETWKRPSDLTTPVAPSETGRRWMLLLSSSPQPSDSADGIDESVRERNAHAPP